jgi:hypothetical protein
MCTVQVPNVTQQYQDGLHLGTKLLVDLKRLLCQTKLNRLKKGRQEGRRGLGLLL